MNLMALLLINTCLITFAVRRLMRSDMEDAEIVKNVGILELAWAGFSILLGLFFLFNFMEATRSNLIESLFQDYTTLRWLIACGAAGMIHFILAILLFLAAAKRRS